MSRLSIGMSNNPIVVYASCSPSHINFVKRTCLGIPQNKYCYPRSSSRTFDRASGGKWPPWSVKASTSPPNRSQRPVDNSRPAQNRFNRDKPLAHTRYAATHGMKHEKVLQLAIDLTQPFHCWRTVAATTHAGKGETVQRIDSVCNSPHRKRKVVQLIMGVHHDFMMRIRPK